MIFHPQTTDGILNFNANQQVELFCSDRLAFPLNGQKQFASCVSGNTFTVNGVSRTVNNFVCQTLPQHTARRRTGVSCFRGATIIEVGFIVENRFIQLMDICHDEILIHTYYVSHRMGPNNDGQQRGFPRPRFQQGSFHPGINIDNLYVRNAQRRAIATTLGSEQLAADLIHPSNDLFLARGHLAAMTDYIFGTEQDATFYLMNAAPQWQTFNSGNWVSVEIGLRRFLRDRNLEADIYTGTHGTLSFPDVNGVRRDLHLFLNGNRVGVPVPMLYYKIAHHRPTRSGIVLIGVNNPYATRAQIDSEFIICTDVSSRINWLNWQRTNIQRGFGYACDVNDFMRVVGHLPNLDIVNLLV